MANQKIATPNSGGGLVRYFDEEGKTLVMLRPEHVLALCIIVGALAILLNIYGRNLIPF